ncbi:MAG: hypothetical protein ACRC3A_04370 [Culicoidibacterales bacterium]
MNNLTAGELTEIIETIQASLHPHSQVKWDYWFRSETYEMLDEWEIDRDTIQQLVHNLTSDDVIKSELQHGNRRGLVLVFAPWLYPSLGQSTFAYFKLALTFDKMNRLHTVSVLSFKAANQTYQFDFPQTSGCQNYYEHNYFTWLCTQPELIAQIPVEELTSYLIETAITTNPRVIVQLPEVVLTKKIIEQACTIDPTVIILLPEKYWHKSLLRAAVRVYPQLMIQLPAHRQSVLIALDACRQEPELLLEIAPRCLERPLLEQVAQTAPEIVAQLGENYLDEQLVKRMLQTDATVLTNLPYAYWNEKRLRRAIKQDPFVLAKVRDTDRTQSIVSDAITIDARVVTVLPRTHVLTLKQMLQAVQVVAEAITLFHDWTPTLVKEVLAINPETLTLLPPQVIDGQMAYELAWEHPHLFPFVPQSYVNQALVDHVLDVQPQLLALVPKQFKQTAMCAKLVATDPSLWQYVPKHIKTRLQQFVPMSA